jgi:hypothetical protein
MTIDEMLQPILNTTAPLQLSDGPHTIPHWDSLAQIEIISAVEDALGQELNTVEVLNLNSVGKVVEVCRARGLEFTTGSS